MVTRVENTCFKCGDKFYTGCTGDICEFSNFCKKCRDNPL